MDFAFNARVIILWLHPEDKFIWGPVSLKGTRTLLLLIIITTPLLMKEDLKEILKIQSDGGLLKLILVGEISNSSMVFSKAVRLRVCPCRQMRLDPVVQKK